jgi:predicted enzyme related to lactoylglutathione lyase
MPDSKNRIVAIILEVADIDASIAQYRDAFGIDLHRGSDNEMAGDRWVDGEHGAISWYEGAYFHFALYQAKAPGQTARLAQVGFMTDDIDAAHARAVANGAKVIHPPRPEPWGMSSRYYDLDGNVIGFTQASR